MTTVETVRLGSKCQMVLPLRMRKALGVSEGDELFLPPAALPSLGNWRTLS